MYPQEAKQLRVPCPFQKPKCDIATVHMPSVGKEIGLIKMWSRR